MHAVFGEAWAFRVPQSRNFMLLARDGGPVNRELLRPGLTAQTELQKVLDILCSTHVSNRPDKGVQRAFRLDSQ